MHDELTARQRAISLRLAGQPVKHICSALGRCEAWFHRWWRRYLEAGPEGLYDLSRASHHIARHTRQSLQPSGTQVVAAASMRTTPGLTAQLASTR